MKKTNPPKVEVSKFNFKEDNHFFDGKIEYRVRDIIDKARDLEVFEIPLAGINLSHYPWEENTSLNKFLFHYKRVQEADLSYPIILDTNGAIADGYHRICKAILENETTIKAVRLKEMPQGYEYDE